MTANAFMSVLRWSRRSCSSRSTGAPRCAGCCTRAAPTGSSVLCETQSELSDRFAGRANPNAPEPRFEVIHDTPLVDGALAHFVANVTRSYWGGDHSLFLGRVEYARYSEGTPLLFHGGRYERLGAPLRHGRGRFFSGS